MKENKNNIMEISVDINLTSVKFKMPFDFESYRNLILIEDDYLNIEDINPILKKHLMKSISSFISSKSKSCKNGYIEIADARVKNYKKWDKKLEME